MDACHEAARVQQKHICSARPVLECRFDWSSYVSLYCFPLTFLGKLPFGNISVEHLRTQHQFHASVCWDTVLELSCVRVPGVVPFRGLSLFDVHAYSRRFFHGLPVHRASIPVPLFMSVAIHVTPGIPLCRASQTYTRWPPDWTGFHES